MDKKISVFVISKDKKILLLKTNCKRYETNYWSIINGGVDDGETFEKAANREVFEETGLQLEKLYFSGYSCTYEYPKDNLRTKKVFIGLVKSNSIKLSDEHEDYKWVSLKNLKKNFSWAEPEIELDKIIQKIKELI